MRRSTALLVVCAAVVVAGVAVDLLRPAPDPVGLPALPRLIPPGTVAALSVSRPDASREFRRAGGVWAAAGSTEPLPEPAVQLLEGLRRELAPLYAFRRVEAALPPAEAGLDPPRLTVTVRLTSGEEFTLRLGDATPEPGGTFARLAGRPYVYVVSSTVADRAERLLGPPA